MKKVILFLFLIVFSFLKSKTQNRIDIIGNGTYCTIKEDGVIKIVGSYRPYPIICNNDTTSISINIDWGITKRIYYSNCILISKIFVNNIQITSYTNLLNILGSIYPATGSGGGGGGSYTFAGNIVNQSGNNIIINQVQPDWTAISGLGAIANKPNIPILDSTQFVKLRDSNKNNNGFITPSFFFANRGSGTKWSNFILGGYLVQKINDSTYTITRDNTTIQDSIRINATIARFTGDSIKRDTSIANRVIGGSVDTIANVITLNKTNGSNINLQLRKAGGGGGGGTATNYPLATMDSIGVIKTGKYIRNNTNYNFSQSNITTPTIKVDYVNGLFLRGSSYDGDANLWTSADGANWTIRASGATNFRFLYYKGKYFAQRYTSAFNLYSNDGITWANTNSSGANAQIVNDTLFTFSNYSNQSGYSTDGITFTQIDPNMQGFGEEFVYSGKGVFVATNYASGQLTPRYFIRGGEWTQINGVDNGTVCRAAFYSTTKKMFILGHYVTNNSYSYYSYDGINYNKCTGMGGDGSQIINIREINGVIFACGGAGIFYSYDGINFFKTNLSYIKPVNDITYNAGVLYSSNLDGTSISYSYDGIFWFTSNYNGIGVIESIAGNGSNRVVVGTSTGVFYNSSLKTDSTLIANITKGLFYDSLGNINIDSNYIKYLIRNNTSGGGGGGTTDTTSLSNRINAKLDVARFTADSTSKQNSINFLRLNKIDSVTINGDTTLLTFYRNGVSSYNIQLKRASGGVVGISTKWNNLSISGYQVQKINDSTYNINRDNTIIQDSIRINGKLDVARFTGDSIRWDTAISNRIINQRIDTNLNRIYYKKTNGKIDSLQLKINGSGGGGVASISNLLTSSLLNNTITSNVNGQTSTANIQAGEVYRKTTQSFSVNLSYSLSNSAYTINTRTLSVFGGLIENQIKYTQNITLTNGSANANIGGAVPNTIVAGNLMEINGDIYRIISVNLNIATLNKSYTGTTNTFTSFSVFSNPINLNVNGIIDANSYKLALVKTLDSAYRLVDKRYKITWGTIGAFNVPINVNFDGSGVPPPPESEFYVYDITQNLPISEAKFELYNQNSLLPISWSNAQFFFDSLYLSNTNQNIANQLIAGNKIKILFDTLNKYKVTISVVDTASITGQTFGTTSVFARRYHSGIVPTPPSYIPTDNLPSKLNAVLQLPFEAITNTYFENSGYGLINGIPYIYTPPQFDPNKGSSLQFPTSITQKSDISFQLFLNTYTFQYNSTPTITSWVVDAMIAKDSMITQLKNPTYNPIDFFNGGVGEESFLWQKQPTVTQTDSTVTISNGIGIIKSDFFGNNIYTGSNNNYYLYLIVRGLNNENFNRVRTFSQNTNDYNMDMRISLQGQGGGSGGSTTTQTNWLVYIQQNDSVVKISDSTTFTTPEATIKAEVYAIYSAGYPIVYRTYPITYQYPSQSIVRGYIQALDYILNVNPITTPNIQITNILTKRNQRY